MDLVIFLNGKQEDILKVQKFHRDEIKFIKIDDKHLSKAGYIKSLIKKDNYKNVFFSSKDMDLQRFHFFMMVYIWLFNSGHGSLIDEKGHRINFSLLRLVFYYSPLLLLEAVASVFVVLYFYIRLPIIKWKLTKNN